MGELRNGYDTFLLLKNYGRSFVEAAASINVVKTVLILLRERGPEKTRRYVEDQVRIMARHVCSSSCALSNYLETVQLGEWVWALELLADVREEG